MKAKFLKAVEEKDILNVRLFLTNELLLDPRGRSFKEMLSYAEANLTGLFESSDEKTYSQTEEEWDKDLMNLLKNDLDRNFSRERLNLYEKVAKSVLKEKAMDLDKEESHTNANGNASATSNNGRKGNEPCSDSSKKEIYGGVAAGGAALTMAGLLPPIAVTVVGVAVTIVGGVLLYKELKK